MANGHQNLYTLGDLPFKELLLDVENSRYLDKTAGQNAALIHMLNDRFGTEFTEADRLFFDQIVQTAREDSVLMEKARTNSPENFRLALEQRLKEMVVDRMDQNSDIVARILSNEFFFKLVMEWVAGRVEV